MKTVMSRPDPFLCDPFLCFLCGDILAALEYAAVQTDQGILIAA